MFPQQTYEIRKKILSASRRNVDIFMHVSEKCLLWIGFSASFLGFTEQLLESGK